MSEVVSRAAGEIGMKIPKWLWDQRIPIGQISLLVGREGIGKSTIAIDIAARLTRGKLIGRYAGHAQSVGIIAFEDSFESVIVPRLLAAGADLSRVHQLEAREEDGALTPILLPSDLDGLEKRCREIELRLLLIDPLVSVIPGAIDTHNDRAVRRALDPLARFCHRTSVGALGVGHLNKGTSTDPLNAVMASRAFTAVARSVLFATTDPEDESGDRYLLGHVKSNLGPKQPTQKYHLIDYRIELEHPDGDGEHVLATSKVVWDGEDERTIRDVLESATVPRGRPVSENTADLLAFITRQGSVTTKDVLAEFDEMNPATVRSTLRRLVKRGDVESPVRGTYTIGASSTQSNGRVNVAHAPLRLLEQQQQLVPQVSGTSGGSGVVAGTEHSATTLWDHYDREI